jgi:hypothetical protein
MTCAASELAIINTRSLSDWGADEPYITQTPYINQHVGTEVATWISMHTYALCKSRVWNCMQFEDSIILLSSQELALYMVLRQEPGSSDW